MIKIIEWIIVLSALIYGVLTVFLIAYILRLVNKELNNDER